MCLYQNYIKSNKENRIMSIAIYSVLLTLTNMNLKLNYQMYLHSSYNITILRHEKYLVVMEVYPYRM